MTRTACWLVAIAASVLAAVGGMALAQDKYAVQVPNGLALAECRGYEDWAAVNPCEATDIDSAAYSFRSSHA
jgi:hypothetical protein